MEDHEEGEMKKGVDSVAERRPMKKVERGDRKGSGRREEGRGTCRY